MEFVIVAPLYFALLGGLFIVADLAVNKIRMHVSDHLVTWVGGSRFCPVNSSGNRDGTLVQNALRTLYDRSIGGELDEDYFKVNSVRDDAAKINEFMGLYKGGVRKLVVKMPGWARGMFEMQKVMTDSGGEEYMSSTLSYDCDYERSFCFNRFPLAYNSSYNRDRNGVSAQDVVTRGYLNNVISDTWIGGAVNQTVPFAVSGSALELPRGRQLGKFAE